MFSGLTKILVFVILGLCVWLWGQLQWIDRLKAENLTQAQTIDLQSKTIAQLKMDAERNRQLTQELMKVEAEVRNKADDVIRYIPEQNKTSDAFNSLAPSNVVEFLQQ